MIELAFTISTLSATIGLIVFMEMACRSGQGSILKGLKRFFNGY